MLKQSHRSLPINLTSKCDLVFVLLEDDSTDRLPTAYQLKSQTKASMKCSQAAVQQHINKCPQHRVGRTPEVSLLGKNMAIQVVESDGSVCTWMGLSFMNNMSWFLFMKRKLFPLNSANSLSIKSVFNARGDRADCALTQNVLWGVRKPVKLFFECISMWK